jgi:hypothetical protein
MATKKAAKPKYRALDVVHAVEGITRKQLSELQHDHLLRIYDINGTLMIEDGELQEAIDRAKKEIRL